MLVIDSASYPHILDRIVFFAPYASLLRLRATSQDLRKRADAFLNAGRIVLTSAHETEQDENETASYANSDAWPELSVNDGRDEDSFSKSLPRKV